MNVYREILSRLDAGCSEGAVIRDVVEIIGTGRYKLMDIDLTGDVTESDGMVCGGTMRVLIEDMTEQREGRSGSVDNMVIKPMETNEEIAGKAFVHCQAWKEAYAGLIDQAFLDGRTVEMSLERARRAFQNGVSTFVAKDGERVAGFADFGPYRGDLADTGEVYAIYILKEYYGKGVGYALMSKALDAMKNYRQIAVWVLEGNERAIHFYTRCGYRFDGQRRSVTLGTPVTNARMILTVEA